MDSERKRKADSPPWLVAPESRQKNAIPHALRNLHRKLRRADDSDSTDFVDLPAIASINDIFGALELIDSDAENLLIEFNHVSSERTRLLDELSSAKEALQQEQLSTKELQADIQRIFLLHSNRIHGALYRNSTATVDLSIAGPGANSQSETSLLTREEDEHHSCIEHGSSGKSHDSDVISSADVEEQNADGSLPVPNVLRRIRADADVVEKRYSDLHVANEGLRKQFESSRREWSSTQSSLQTRIDELMREKSQLDAHVAELKELVVNQQATAAIHEARSATLETEKSTLLNQVEALSESLRSTKDDLDTTRFERDAYHSELTALRLEKSDLVKQMEQSKVNMTSECEKLRGLLGEARDELDAARQDWSRKSDLLTEELKTLKLMCDDKDEVLGRERKEKEDISSALGKLESKHGSELKRKQKEIDILTGLLTTCQDDLRHLAKEKDELEARFTTAFDEAESTICALRTDLQDSRLSRDRLSEEKHALAERVETLSTQFQLATEDARLTISALETDLQNVRTFNKKLSEEKLELEDRTKSLATQMESVREEAQSTISGLKVDLQSSEAVCNRLLKEKAELEERLAQLSHDFETARKETQQTISALTLNYQNSKSAFDKLTDEKLDLEERLSGLLQQLESAQKQSSLQRQSLEEKLRGAAEKEVAYESRINSLAEQVDAWNAKHSNLDKIHKETVSKVDSMVMVEQQHLGAIETLKQQNEDHLHQVEALEEKLRGAISENTRLSEELQSAHDALAVADNQIATWEIKSHHELDRAVKAEHYADQLSKQVEEIKASASKSVEDLTNRLEEQTAALQDFERKTSELKQQVDDYRQHYEDERARADVLAETVQQLRSEILDQSERWESMRSALSKDLEDKSALLLQKTEKIATLTAALDDSKESLAQQHNTLLEKLNVLEMLQQQLSELQLEREARCKALEEAIVKAECERDEAETTARAHVDSAESLRVELQLLHEEKARLTAELTQTISESEKTSLRLAELQHSQNDLASRFLAQGSELEQKISEVCQLQDERELLRRSVTDLKTRIDELDSESKTFVEQLRLAQEETCGLHATVQTLTESLEKVRAERDEAHQRLESSNADLAQMQVERDRKAQQVDDLLREVDSLTCRYKDACDLHMEEKTEWESKNEKCVEELRLTREALSSAKQSIESLQQQLDGAQVSMEKLQSEHATAVESLVQIVKSSKEQISEQQSRFQAMEEELGVTKENLRQALDQHTTLIASNETLLRNVADLEERIEQLDTAAKEAAERERHLLGQVEMLEAAVKDKLDTIEFLETESAVYRKQNTDLLCERDKAVEQLRDAQEKVAEQSRVLMMKEEELGTLQNNMKDSAAHNGRLEQTVEEMSLNKQQLEGEINRLNQDRARLVDQINSLKEQMNERSDGFSTVEAELEDQRKRNQELSLEITKLGEQHEADSRLICEHQKDLDGCEKEIQNLRHEISRRQHLEDALSRTEGELARFRGLLEVEQQRCKELSHDVDDGNNKIAEFEHALRERDSLIDRQRAEKQETEGELAKFRELLEVEQQRCKELRHDIDEGNNKVAEFECALRERESLIDRLRAEKQVTEVELARFRELLEVEQQRCKELCHDVDDGNNKIAEFECALRERDSLIDRQQAEKHELDCAVTSLQTANAEMSDRLSVLEQFEREVQAKEEELKRVQVELMDLRESTAKTLEHLESEAARHETSAQEIEFLRRQLQQTKESHTAEIAEIQSAIKLEIGEATDALRKENEKLYEELVDAYDKVKDVKLQSEWEVAQLMDKLDSANQSRDRSEADLAEVKAGCDELRKELSSLKAATAKDVEDKEELIVRLRDAIATVESENAELREMIKRSGEEREKTLVDEGLVKRKEQRATPSPSRTQVLISPLAPKPEARSVSGIRSSAKKKATASPAVQDMAQITNVHVMDSGNADDIHDIPNPRHATRSSARKSTKLIQKPPLPDDMDPSSTTMGPPTTPASRISDRSIVSPARSSTRNKSRSSTAMGAAEQMTLDDSLEQMDQVAQEGGVLSSGRSDLDGPIRTVTPIPERDRMKTETERGSAPAVPDEEKSMFRQPHPQEMETPALTTGRKRLSDTKSMVSSKRSRMAGTSGSFATPSVALKEMIPPNTSSSMRTQSSVASSNRLARAKYVICFSGFKDNDESEYNGELRAKLVKAIRQLPDGFVLSRQSNFDPKTTHVIAAPQSKTLKTYAASLTSKWLIYDYNWVFDSASAGYWLPEDKYGFLSKDKPFAGKKFYIAPSFQNGIENNAFKMGTLKTLVTTFGEGEFVNDVEEADIVIRGSEDQSFTNKRSADWVGFMNLIPQGGLPTTKE
ncbi:hypothetical protein HK102_013704 [Quaeritorhiza haematococci]|nr:hypothetical protein HK102_013704 [Quaeritorhiza haematococci]